MQDMTRKPSKVIVAGHVDPELAQAVRRLANQGNGTVSREIAVLGRFSTGRGARVRS
jgi:hypothetical protein